MSNWIKKGLSVVNITNLDVVMTVDHPIFQSREVKGDQDQPKRVSRLVGIELKILNDKGTFDKVVNHSKELIPLSVACKGRSECYKFINREGEYKNY